ncbi:MAG: ABC transporter permease [Dictyoglomaceae bacterium]
MKIIERWQWIFEKREVFPLFALLGLIIVSSIISPYFFTVINFRNILAQVAVIAVLAAGETFVILVGGIDLSPGSVLALSGAVVAYLMKFLDVHPFLAIIFALSVGTFAGLINGFLVTKVKIPSFVATLSMMAVARGGALIITGGSPISLFPPTFRLIARYLGPVSGLTFIMLFIYILGQFILSKTRLGRYIYALGGNEEALRYSGIKADKVKLFVFAFSGFCSALGGVMLTARLDSAYPIAGEGYELDAIASSVLGGISFVGGVGSLIGTFMGALIMTILGNILNLLQVPPFYQYLARGLVLAIAATSLARGVRFAK